jgi:hypothetical protein
MRRGRAENLHVAARNAESLQQRVHRELRMVRCGMYGEFALRVLASADSPPGLVVEIGIESRQHHRAMRQRGNRMEESRGCRHRAGRPRRDHRGVLLRGQPRGLRRDQQIAPRRRLDLPDLREMVGPCLARDLQELQRVLPILVELIRHEGVERVPCDVARHHVVDQPRQVAGQCQR